MSPEMLKDLSQAHLLELSDDVRREFIRREKLVEQLQIDFVEEPKVTEEIVETLEEVVEEVDIFANLNKKQRIFLNTKLRHMPGSFYKACEEKLDCFTVEDILRVGYPTYQAVVNRDTRSTKRPGKKVTEFRNAIAVYGLEFV